MFKNEFTLCGPKPIKMNPPDFKAIAAQLRQPSGDDGISTAEHMSQNNDSMISCCIDHLSVQDTDWVLEIGPGGGGHLPYLLTKANGIHYAGIDISATMVDMAIAQNKEDVEKGIATFTEVQAADGYVTIPFEDGKFDRIFTVNTLYFWDNAVEQAREIYRVLKPGGQLALCFAAEDFMKTLPFTEYGFHLYDTPKATALLVAAGFTISGSVCKKEQLVSNSGASMEREFIVLLAGKV